MKNFYKKKLDVSDVVSSISTSRSRNLSLVMLSITFLFDVGIQRYNSSSIVSYVFFFLFFLSKTVV